MKVDNDLNIFCCPYKRNVQKQAHCTMDQTTKNITILHFLLKHQAHNYSCLSEVIYVSAYSNIFLFSLNPDWLTAGEFGNIAKWQQFLLFIFWPFHYVPSANQGTVSPRKMIYSCTSRKLFRNTIVCFSFFVDLELLANPFSSKNEHYLYL